MKRVETGIEGLDDLLQGGLVKGSSVLVSGATGTGKTILGMQYLWEGLKRGDNCLFITFEESPKDIKQSASLFGWDFEKHEENENLSMKHMLPFTGEQDDLFWFKDEIKESNIDRAVIDSTSILSLYYKDKYNIRKNLFKLVKLFKETNTTSLLTTETPSKKELSRYNVEEYVTDGVIKLYFMGVGKKGYRALQIRKMRDMEHSMETRSFEITGKGIKIEDKLI
ncbi:MAG: RAD55 family ATPase [Candidatus Aenigmatarchaeota archaeon]